MELIIAGRVLAFRPVQAGISCADQGHGATRVPEQRAGESCSRGWCAGRCTANSRPEPTLAIEAICVRNDSVTSRRPGSRAE